MAGHEYRASIHWARGAAAFTESERAQIESGDPARWLEGLQSYTKRWVEQHQGGGADKWTVVADSVTG